MISMEELSVDGSSGISDGVTITSFKFVPLRELSPLYLGIN